MRQVVLIDTTIFLNILDVPGFNQKVGEVLAELERHVRQSASLLLPFASIIETGNHIAHVADGNLRREYAQKFVEQVTAALKGDAPWQASSLPDAAQLIGWLTEFPDAAMRGISVADLTIIKEWEATRERHPRLRVTIWTLDKHLMSYDASGLRMRLRRRD